MHRIIIGFITIERLKYIHRLILRLLLLEPLLLKLPLNWYWFFNHLCKMFKAGVEFGEFEFDIPFIHHAIVFLTEENIEWFNVFCLIKIHNVLYPNVSLFHQNAIDSVRRVIEDSAEHHRHIDVSKFIEAHVDSLFILLSQNEKG